MAKTEKKFTTLDKAAVTGMCAFWLFAVITFNAPNDADATQPNTATTVVQSQTTAPARPTTTTQTPAVAGGGGGVGAS